MAIDGVFLESDALELPGGRADVSEVAATSGRRAFQALGPELAVAVNLARDVEQQVAAALAQSAAVWPGADVVARQGRLCRDCLVLSQAQEVAGIQYHCQPSASV